MKYILSSKQFKEALKEGKFLGLKCKQCGAYAIPPQKVCPECNSEDMEVIEFSGNGEIQTFTVIHVPPEGFEGPYIIGMVKLDEGPWITANIVDVDPEKASMELIGRRGTVGYKEVPADKHSAGERVALTFSVTTSR